MHKIHKLFSKRKIKDKITLLADAIARENESVYCIVILKGSIFFFSDLCAELRHRNVEVFFDFIKIRSYVSMTSKDIRVDCSLRKIQRPDVLIIDDIVDTGRTISFLKRYVKKLGAKTVKTCTLLYKGKKSTDYSCFKVPDKFVVGYGLDYNEKYRDLDYVGYMKRTQL